jgi:hypothetical protein
MLTDTLWTLVEDCRRQGLGGCARDAWLLDTLSRQPPDGIVRFQACLDHLLGESLSWNLWAAADRILGTWCSDQSFCFFQCWLLGLGRPVFETAVADPDVLALAPEVRRLARLPRPDWPPADRPGWELLTALPARAYEAAAGGFEDGGDAFYRAARRVLDEEGLRPAPLLPRGHRWSARDEAEAARRLPRLAAMFPLER